MNHEHDGHASHGTELHAGSQGFWSSRYAIGLLVLGAVAAYFLLTEHLAHTLSALPYLLLLACPLMHVFMHRGHSGHGHHHGYGAVEAGAKKTDDPEKGKS